ncbi:hypothetical protein SISSUDRAFT_1129994 [Sistotremastrum suecicum HHB10207 ss-3]|uniref:Uncharacterized protein n=1 Tax=Sistotremastrum suecicum HHB10207 ss-3 TaxID=1314776 RepID=A0A166C071_9AGAM|nr:hypothetical protein SISSUDRAFT_1129994 [Sistotremastrum suecicum HHB10207 ss-3]
MSTQELNPPETDPYFSKDIKGHIIFSTSSEKAKKSPKFDHEHCKVEVICLSNTYSRLKDTDIKVCTSVFRLIFHPYLARFSHAKVAFEFVMDSVGGKDRTVHFFHPEISEEKGSVKSVRRIEEHITRFSPQTGSGRMLYSQQISENIQRYCTLSGSGGGQNTWFTFRENPHSSTGEAESGIPISTDVTVMTFCESKLTVKTSIEVRLESESHQWATKKKDYAWASEKPSDDVDTICIEWPSQPTAPSVAQPSDGHTNGISSSAKQVPPYAGETAGGSHSTPYSTTVSDSPWQGDAIQGVTGYEISFPIPKTAQKEPEEGTSTPDANVPSGPEPKSVWADSASPMREQAQSTSGPHVDPSPNNSPGQGISTGEVPTLGGADESTMAGGSVLVSGGGTQRTRETVDAREESGQNGNSEVNRGSVPAKGGLEEGGGRQSDESHRRQTATDDGGTPMTAPSTSQDDMRKTRRTIVDDDTNPISTLVIDARTAPAISMANDTIHSAPDAPAPPPREIHNVNTATTPANNPEGVGYGSTDESNSINVPPTIIITGKVVPVEQPGSTQTGNRGLGSTRKVTPATGENETTQPSGNANGTGNGQEAKDPSTSSDPELHTNTPTVDAKRENNGGTSQPAIGSTVPSKPTPPSVPSPTDGGNASKFEGAESKGQEPGGAGGPGPGPGSDSGSKVPGSKNGTGQQGAPPPGPKGDPSKDKKEDP